MVELLIKHGADTSATNSVQQGPAHYAAAKGHRDVLLFLIANGAAANAADKELSTPLHEAASHGHTACVDVLLAAGANLGALDLEGCGVLHFAAFNGWVPLCQAFVAKGCSVDQRDAYNRTPFLFGASGGHQAVLQALMEMGADISAQDNDGWSALHWAADGGFMHACMELQAIGCSSVIGDVRGMLAVHYAAAGGHDAVVEILAEGSENIWQVGDVEKGWTALHYAADGNHKAVLEVFVKLGARVKVGDKDGRSPLDVARTSGAAECVTFLQEEEAEDHNEMVAWIRSEVAEPHIPRCVSSSGKPSASVEQPTSKDLSPGSSTVEDCETGQCEQQQMPALAGEVGGREHESVVWAAMIGGSMAATQGSSGQSDAEKNPPCGEPVELVSGLGLIENTPEHCANAG